MNRLIFSFLLTLLMLASCNNNAKQKDSGATPSAKQKSSDATSAEDSADLRIAIVPTMDCLPFFVAQEKGIYRKLGVSVDFVVYQSQMDADQSVCKGKTDGCTTDLFRTVWMQNEKYPVRFLFCMDREWQLIAGKTLRVTKIRQLNDRMIAIARNSMPDYLCDYFATQMKGTTGQLLRPQINDITIRENMLSNHQLDAAVLPLPQAWIAVRKGNTCLFSSRKGYRGFAGLCASTKALARHRMRTKFDLLMQGYNIAVDSLTSAPTFTASDAIIRTFHLQGMTQGLKPRQTFAHAFRVPAGRVATALQWMKGRQLLRAGYNGDTIVYQLNK